MNRQEMRESLKQYNQTLAHCTQLEQQFLNAVDKSYFYGFYISDISLPNKVEDFLRHQHNFKHLLPDHHEKLSHYLRHIQEWTANKNLIRMDARSANFAYYEGKVVRAIGAFYAFYGSGMSMRELIYGQYRDCQSSIDFSAVIAERLLADDPAVIQYCQDVLTGENNTAVLSRDVIVAIEQSHCGDLQKLLTRVFLAARLQEGLRQQVIETVDENNLDYFFTIIEAVHEHDLLRYASVQRGVLTWIGIGYELVKEKDVRYIFETIRSFIHDPSTRDRALTAEQPLNIYLALYCIGLVEVDQAIQKAIALLDQPQRHVVACALIYLKMTNCPLITRMLPQLPQYQDDEWIMALLISEWCRVDFKKARLSKAEMAVIFDQSMRFVSTMKSQQTYTAKGFSWFSVTLDKTAIGYKLFELLELIPSQARVEQCLPYVASQLRGKKLETFMTQSFSLLDQEQQKAFFLKEIISANEALAGIIEKLYCELSLSDEDIRCLEARLSSKKGTARAHIVNVLAAQSDRQVQASYERLIESTHPSIRESALELKRKAPHCFDEDAGETKIYGSESGFGLYSPHKSYNMPYTSKIKTIKKGFLVKKTVIDFAYLFPWNKEQVLAYLSKWGARIIAHQDDEYYNGYEYRQIKSAFYPLNYREHSLASLPCGEVWEAYFQEDQLSADVVFELRLLLEGIAFNSFLSVQTPLFYLTEKEVGDIPYYRHISTILSYYFYRYEGCQEYRHKACMLLEIILRYGDGYQYVKKYYDQEYLESLYNLFPFLYQQLHFETADAKTFREYFPILISSYEAFNLRCRKETLHKFTFSPLMLSRAVLMGLLPKEILYESILDTHNETQVQYMYTNAHQLTRAYQDAYFEGGSLWQKPHFDLKTYHHGRTPYDKDVVALLREQLDVIADQLIAMEKTRLNEQTAVTSRVKNLYVVNGIEHFITAAHVLAHDDLKRQSGGNDRNAVFTDLIRHCYPRPNDQPQTLQKEHFPEQRLVEFAMLAPQWIDLINQVLAWDGFQEGCYFFIAHMKQYHDEQKKAQIAHYTRLDPQDLRDGAFDMDWCKRVYERLGESHFQMLYQAAKFLCDNSFHTRARKYADACLRKKDLQVFYEQMRQKRNKDALNAYCIYPLQDDEDLLRRYQEVQRFLKESKQFGAQRQAGEKRACEIALMNLAANSPYETVTRLSWMMESEMVKQNAAVLTPQPIEDGQIWIEIDEQGRNQILVEKKQRRLKSIPAKLKKHETVLAIKQIHQLWDEQYRRSRAMLEQAMTAGTLFTHVEIQTIMKNPIVAPMLAKLVLLSDERLGFYEAGCLRGLHETFACGDTVQIAHPYDLYRHQCWHEYQAYLYQHQIVQPFKQVFRELYLKLEEERDQSASKRYSGYQIQPKKASAVLKARKWNVSEENGLEKIDYGRRLAVNLYAQADWFSPSDIEAPCIDYVQFSRQKDHTPLAMKDVDDIAFSEIMRDIDLAVSTAYVGGVDPITSFSTMELRKTIMTYTVQLMKLANVEVGDHFVNINGSLNRYSVHLGSGIVHQEGGGAIHIIPVWSGQRGKVYLPFLDEDPKTAEIISKVIMLAQDEKLKDPSILAQIQRRNHPTGS